ncbi:lethal(3)malignant brain tumor-like protein 3 isoform X2 [Hypanus sabinus]|uniref:lethal(3)malignant brain tumor-like protein 3 isoform X2 n=1 Tax=Hypanus sabinus TaxID=79690 RepID=UPI0028C3BE1E|nr:lethal(3)malignant brain tumor-like protein 3 isoform X2 [Hypanus sabinus]
MEKSIMSDCSPATGSQDFDVFSAMDWKDGIATLPGSDLKFRINEFGALEIITDETEVDRIKKATATTTWSVPTAQEVLSRNSVPSNMEEPPSMEGILCCENCGHYGMTEEFSHGSKFCSEKCTQQAKEKVSVLKKEPPTCNSEEVSKYNRKKRQKPALSLKGDIKENGEMLKEEEEDIEEKAGELKMLKVTQNNQTRARRKRKCDSGLLKQTLTFGGKRKTWCWASYLDEEKAVAAPTKLFREYQSFPQSKNGFKVGMKLEGVDPEHPSMYCVLTVAEVSGYRIRLHFDKYADCYDFWVNADSPDIHPVGWCEKTGHKLNPPRGYREDEFNWPTYLKMCKAQAVPKSLFENQNTTITPLGFRLGMKLEAVDKKNPEFICVATVSDMVDNRFLVHFDNWDESYDYWCDATSPYIHPVGWCQQHGKILTIPPDYHDPKHFSWEKYLEETNSLPAPARAFKSRPAHGFLPNMKFEVVDKRNPMLIRVASVIDTDDHRVLIHFDGWNHDYDYWIDADSADIHPAGWCAKTGHPLQPPISPLDLVEASEQGGCPTPGCKGIGHIKGVKHSGHHSALGCPYSEINLNRENVLQDRLNGEMPVCSPGIQRNKKVEADGVETIPCSSTITSQGAGRPLKHPRLKEEEDVSNKVNWQNDNKENDDSSLQQALHQSVFMSSACPVPSLPLCWEQHSKLLPGVAGITARKVAKWTIDEVSEFILSLPGCEEQAKAFKHEQIDGEAFLLLTQTDIVKIMSIKLGPALKIYNSILMFKTAEENGQNEL